MIEGARYPDLAGRPVLITGAGAGLGASMVLHFARQGAQVAALEVNEAAARRTADEARQDSGAEIALEIVDLRDIPATRIAIARLAARLGPFRALVNNAGDDARHALAEVTPELWDDRFAVNARHQFFAAQAIAPGMAEAGGGAIINLGSISWMFGAVGLVAYTTAKSAIEGLTKSLARELGTRKIRVNSIAPGWVLTEKQVERARSTDPAKFQAYLDRQCLKEHLAPADVAKLALWLASDEARLCTGQTFILDAGVV